VNCNIIFSFSALDSLLTLYFSIVRPLLDCANLAWNSVNYTDANRLEGIEGVSVAQYTLCIQFFSPDVKGYSYANARQILNLRTCHERKYQMGTIFVISVIWGGGVSKYCPSSMGILHLTIPTWKHRDLPLFQVSPSFKKMCQTCHCSKYRLQ
jgi:hypothetical protein